MLRIIVVLLTVLAVARAASADEVVLLVADDVATAPQALLREVIRRDHDIVPLRERVALSPRVEAHRDPDYLMRLPEIGRTRNLFFSGFTYEVIDGIEYWLSLLRERPWLVVAHPDAAVVTLDALILYPRVVMMADDVIGPDEALARVHRYFWGVPPNPDTVSPNTTAMWDELNATVGSDRGVRIEVVGGACEVFGPGGALVRSNGRVQVPSWTIVVRVECEDGTTWFESWAPELTETLLAPGLTIEGEAVTLVQTLSQEAMASLERYAQTEVVTLTRATGGFELSSSARSERVFVPTAVSLDVREWERAWDVLRDPLPPLDLEPARDPGLPLARGLGAASLAFIGLGVWQEIALTDAVADVDECADSRECVAFYGGMSEQRRDARWHRGWANVAWAGAGLAASGALVALLSRRDEQPEGVDLSVGPTGVQVRCRW